MVDGVIEAYERVSKSCRDNMYESKYRAHHKFIIVVFLGYVDVLV